MEAGDINILESIFESPLFQIALENIPCPRQCQVFLQVEKIFHLRAKKALQPLIFLKRAAKKLDIIKI